MQLARDNNVHLLVPYGWHYKPFLQTAKAWLDAGRIGTVQHALCHMASPIRDLLEGKPWVTDGNYSAVLPAILARATHVVWLDYERPIIMWRVITRSFARAWTKQEVWPGTGNRETFAQWRDPEHPVRWAWKTFARRRTRYTEIFADPRLAHLDLTRLRHPRHADPLVGRLRHARPSRPAEKKS